VVDEAGPKDVQLPPAAAKGTAAAAAAAAASKPAAAVARMHEGFTKHVKHSSVKPCIPLVAAAVVAAAEGDDHDYFDPSAAGNNAFGTAGGLGSARGSRNSLLQRISNKIERVYGGSAAANAADSAAPAAHGVLSQGDAAEGSRGCCGLLQRYGSLIAALVMCQVGMILFNIGLTYGFTGGF
jgi:hypothetical protein